MRDNAIAAEAFPAVTFWRGLDIRWLRHSLGRGGVGEALRELKQVRQRRTNAHYSLRLWDRRSSRASPQRLVAPPLIDKASPEGLP